MPHLPAALAASLLLLAASAPAEPPDAGAAAGDRPAAAVLDAGASTALPDGGAVVAEGALAADGPTADGGGGAPLAAAAPGSQAEPPGPAVPEEPDDEGDGEDSGGDEEAESQTAEAAGGPDIVHTRDLGDTELQRRWQGDLESLGSISVGFADQGRVINAVHLDDGDGWICQRRDLAWGAKETVDALAAAFRAVHARFPDSAPARLSHIGAREGGWLRPHRSHQSGRDADIGFFYKRDAPPGGRARREKLIDPARNWQLVRALVTLADVQVLWVDRGILQVLREHALAAGEDRTWIDRLFRGGGGEKPLLQHARRHRDHFHVRFFAPRSQELGRRIQPLLAMRPDQNLLVVRVKNGQTLGHLARAYKSTVPAIMQANHMRKTFLHAGQRLLVPMRGPCTKCPLPPPVQVPPRRLPPEVREAAAAAPPPPVTPAPAPPVAPAPVEPGIAPAPVEPAPAAASPAGAAAQP